MINDIFLFHKVTFPRNIIHSFYIIFGNDRNDLSANASFHLSGVNVLEIIKLLMWSSWHYISLTLSPSLIMITITPSIDLPSCVRSVNNFRWKKKLLRDFDFWSAHTKATSATQTVTFQLREPPSDVTVHETAGKSFSINRSWGKLPSSLIFIIVKKYIYCNAGSSATIFTRRNDEDDDERIYIL